MRLLHAGVDTSVIALWLGHEQIETTQIYLDADMALKRGSARKDHAAEHAAGALPATRRAARLPRSDLIMPTSPTHDPPTCSPFSPESA
jgi:integrase